jgi:7-cyano-7-deazaguanine synthase in queuosine biosynthesis
MNNFEVAVLATGGMDSTLVLYNLVRYQEKRPTVIHIDYGQKAAAKEQELLRRHLKRLYLHELVVLPLTFNLGAKTGLFSEGYKLSRIREGDDKDQYEEGEMKYSEMFIQGRNAFIVLTAMAYCSEHKIDELHCGFVNNQATWNKQRTAFHLFTNDSSPHFVDAINMLALTGFSHYVRFKAPLLDERIMDKELVHQMCIEHEIDVENETYSCYFYPPCEECMSCKTRETLLKYENKG